jgi:hypothetical protein
MAIDSLAVWQSTFEALPKQADWTQNFVDWVDDRVTSKMELPGLFHASGTPFTFTFTKATMKTALDALTTTDDQAQAISDFADAWGDAVTASVAVVIPLTYIGTDTPTTKWSVVTTTLIDPASITAGKAVINTLASEPPAATSKFPEKFRDAFLSLTVTTTGLDSTPTPAGPLPLVDPARAVA